MNQMTDKIKRYVFPYIDSNMYILIEGAEALVIDPHFSEDAFTYLAENHVKKVLMILTHEHFDHVNGIPWFREHFDTRLICQKEALNEKRQKYFNRPLLEVMKLQEEGREKEAEEVKAKFLSYVYRAEEIVEESYETIWRSYQIQIEHIPGHSPASCMILFDKTIYFTGDSLIPDRLPTLHWPWSDEKLYKEVALPKLFEISEQSYVYPGHGDPVKMSFLTYIDNYFAAKR